MSSTVIAVDGPAASGKTTVGRLLAKKLGYRFLDTGVMYRAVTWAALDTGVNPHNSHALVVLAQERPPEVALPQDGPALVMVGGRDVSPYLRDQQVEQNVSLVAQVPGVRDVLVELQRRVAREGRIVMVGRDIGTVVLPDAPLKVFLTASVAERARRRYTELQASGENLPFTQVMAGLSNRDTLDSEREVAPLKPAPDAQIIATDNLTVDMVVERILELMRQRSWA